MARKGERRDVTLADGSRVLLDADSAFSVEVTPQLRRVHLLRGAAFFDVTPSQTPFVVATAAGDVRVLGTQFDVRLIDDAALVTLAKGSVAVTAGGAVTPAMLKPGQQVWFSATVTHAPVSVNVADEMAWREGCYIFYRARLADVVREVERYRPGRILIPASALANERVTGSFSLADSDVALVSLQASVGFQMRKVTERLVILYP
ncbi:MAG: FecR family protein [Symbiopectobacterium sp.]|uniref:FecR family protein n=1 Tax=Symbiopectobacterium sp. TaxID=2952789 RepID=UPI0039EBF4FD